MEAHKPTQIEMPPPADEASMLAFYLEGVPLVQIARALQVGVPTVLDFLRNPDVRACIEQYEESIEQQTRLCALASRIPAMVTLREVCASQGSLAERRRAASDLLRQSRAAEKPAKGGRFNRTAHNTQAPEKFIPKLDIEPLSEVPRHVRPPEPRKRTQGVSPKPSADPNIESPVDSQPSPIATNSPSENVRGQPSTPVSHPDQVPLEGSFTAHDHTASWHAFERIDPDPSANLISTSMPPTPDAASQAPAQTDQPINEPIDPPIERPLLVQQPPTRISSPYDSICPPEISSPLPDAVPVAA